MGLLFLGDIIALRAMGVFPKYALLPPEQPDNPKEVWDAFRSCCLGIIGPPESIRMDGGGNGRMRFGRICVQSG